MLFRSSTSDSSNPTGVPGADHTATAFNKSKSVSCSVMNTTNIGEASSFSPVSMITNAVHPSMPPQVAAPTKTGGYKTESRKDIVHKANKTATMSPHLEAKKSSPQSDNENMQNSSPKKIRKAKKKQEKKAKKEKKSAEMPIDSNMHNVSNTTPHVGSHVQHVNTAHGDHTSRPATAGTSDHASTQAGDPVSRPTTGSTEHSNKASANPPIGDLVEIGRASCRERVCQYV